MNMEEELKLITPEILPPGCDFLEQQKNAILLEGNANIVAGPGSGKTTVLIAKCALLLRKYINSNMGICLITHTNVAVDEIRMGLKKLGISNFQYPNFIGTIQDFINTFFTKKAFHLILGDQEFNIIDDEEYQEVFEEIFEEQKPDWYTYSIPSVSKGNPRLHISNDLSFSFTSNVKISYRDSFNKSLKILFGQGIVTNLQCLEMANWFIEQYTEQIRKAIQSRFRYVLLDEAQDTSQLQYEILNKLFEDSNVIFQKFGDPYQALYSIFDGNNDAWVPSKEIAVPYEEISETSRFGTTIANIIKNVCIEKYNTFKSQNLVNSFKPYYLIYKNEDDLLEQYRGLIEYCNNKSVSFSCSNKKDAILAAFHDNLTSLFSSYKRPTTKVRNSESLVKKCTDFLLTLLTKETDLTFKELRERVSMSLDFKVILSKCIKSIISENISTETINNQLKEVLKIVTNNKKSIFTIVDINSVVESFRKSLSQKEMRQSQKEKEEFYIGTIHSSKGETHRSTLLVLNTIFKSYENDFEYSMFELLTEYLAGNHIDPMTIRDKNKKNETIKALKLAYVALSRPTHLLAIAIPEKMICDDRNMLDRLDKNGWEMYGKSFSTIT